MKRRTRVLVLACYFLVGAFLTQWGACYMFGVNTLVPIAGVNLVDSNGNLFGLWNVCGIPNVLEVPATGGASTLINSEDDLVTVCPYTVQVTNGSGG